MLAAKLVIQDPLPDGDGHWQNALRHAMLKPVYVWVHVCTHLCSAIWVHCLTMHNMCFCSVEVPNKKEEGKGRSPSVCLMFLARACQSCQWFCKYAKCLKCTCFSRAISICDAARHDALKYWQPPNHCLVMAELFGSGNASLQICKAVAPFSAMYLAIVVLLAKVLSIDGLHLTTAWVVAEACSGETLYLKYQPCVGRCRRTRRRRGLGKSSPPPELRLGATK